MIWVNLPEGLPGCPPRILGHAARGKGKRRRLKQARYLHVEC